MLSVLTLPLKRFYRAVAVNEVNWAVAPCCTSMPRPHRPDWKVLSAAVSIQAPGSGLPICHTLAGSVEPTTVRYPSPKGRDLCLCSTAILHSVAAVQLWLHRMTHQGQLTSAPYSSSLAG